MCDYVFQSFCFGQKPLLKLFEVFCEKFFFINLSFHSQNTSKILKELQLSKHIFSFLTNFISENFLQILSKRQDLYCAAIRIFYISCHNLLLCVTSSSAMSFYLDDLAKYLNFRCFGTSISSNLTLLSFFLW